jgi:thiamine-phosphate pyrophosphorylase
MELDGLYAILDLPHRGAVEPAIVVEAMILGGARVIQLRSKQAPLAPALVRELGERCEAAAVPLIINDELELAEAGIPGVAGVHLGQGDLSRLGQTREARRARREALRASGLVLGVSTHDLDQLRAAEEQLDPAYLGFGPVFATASKAKADPVVGVAGLERASALASRPVVAIGGIGLGEVPRVIGAGAAAVAVIGAVIDRHPETIRERCRALSQAIDRARGLIH